jgi:hypothetical protein
MTNIAKMDNIAMMAADPGSGAKKVGTYDIPEDRPTGTPPPPPPEPSRGLSWLWWLLGLLVLLALLAWAFNSCMPGAGTTTPPAATVAAPADGAVVPPAGDAAGDAAAVDNTAVCTAVTDYEAVAASAPVITAETPVADVQAYNDQVQTAGTALTSAAAAVPDLDVTAFTNALGALGASVAGLTGDVVGDAADGLNAAFTSVTDSVTGVSTAAGCL